MVIHFQAFLVIQCPREQEEVFDTCEGKTEEFGDEDLEFGQEDADFKEFEDFSRRRSGRFRKIRRLCQL